MNEANDEGVNTLTHKICTGVMLVGEIDRCDLVYLLTPPCPFCGEGEGHAVVMPMQAFLEWQGEGPRRHIQTALEMYTAEHRDYLKLGVHPACWEAFLNSTEDEDMRGDEYGDYE